MQFFYFTFGTAGDPTKKIEVELVRENESHYRYVTLYFLPQRIEILSICVKIQISFPKKLGYVFFYEQIFSYKCLCD
jgi:hypothetical protein